jgi:uncharacterized protein
MAPSFYVGASLFHAAALAGGVWFVHRSTSRTEPGGDGLGRWSVRVARDTALWLGGAAVLAALLCLGLSLSGFAWMRLVCQGLFGELPLLLAAIAVAHGRAGRAGRAALVAGGGLALVGVYWQAYHREPTQLVVRRHSLDLAHEGDGTRRLRIVHLTDIQTEAVGAHERAAVALAMRETPDLIVFTGDYAYGPRATADLRRVLLEGGLRAPLGVYAVPGDVQDDGPALFAGLGVACLENRSVRVPLPEGGALTLIGLSTAMSRTHNGDKLVRLVRAAPPADLTLVLGHAPDFIAELAGRIPVDLALAGHTHGGQVVLPLFGPPLTLSRLPRRYAGGLNDYDGVPLHVSRGVGMERGAAPRIRFNCPPELCVLDVRY